MKSQILYCCDFTSHPILARNRARVGQADDNIGLILKQNIENAVGTAFSDLREMENIFR